jgi:hypothetical protein
MEEFQVSIPEEDYSILNFTNEDLPGVAVVNMALKDWEPKEVFSYHLSVIIDFEEVVDNGMPSREEGEAVDALEEKLQSLIKGPDIEKPNALFLARVTWNHTRQILWRVFDPEAANEALQGFIDGKSNNREFDYHMEEDTEWKYAEWYLMDR